VNPGGIIGIPLGSVGNENGKLGSPNAGTGGGALDCENRSFPSSRRSSLLPAISTRYVMMIFMEYAHRSRDPRR
jgi:hypothetical protein